MPPRVWKQGPSIDWKLFPGYQLFRREIEQKQQQKQDTPPHSENEDQERKEYSCENNIEEEIDLPELDDQNQQLKRTMD